MGDLKIPKALLDQILGSPRRTATFPMDIENSNLLADTWSVGFPPLGVRMRHREMKLQPELKDLSNSILLQMLKASEMVLKYTHNPEVSEINKANEILEILEKRCDEAKTTLIFQNEIQTKMYCKLRNEIYQYVGWENHFDPTWFTLDGRNYEEWRNSFNFNEITEIFERVGKVQNEQNYTINVRSRFVITQSQAKRAFGPGFQVLSVEFAKDASELPIIDVDSAALAIIKTGYRALARAYHPDLGGDGEIMRTLNRCKKELEDLINSLKGV